MENEISKRIEVLESKVSLLGDKLKEIVSCLEDNELFMKMKVDYLFLDEDEEDELDEELEEKLLEKNID